MRLYPNQIQIINQVLDKVIKNGKVLDQEIYSAFQNNKKWGSRDRKNFSKACYDIIRHYEFLKEISHESSIIDTYTNILLEGKTIEEVRDRHKFSADILYSIPSDLYAIYKAENPSADQNLKAMNQSGNIYLRINTSLMSFDEFCAELKREGIEFEPISSITIDNHTYPMNAVKLNARTQTHQAFFDRMKPSFEIQDLGSQLLTEFIGIENIGTIIESCAGQGGKTAHIVDKTRKSLHIAFDNDRKKLLHLVERIKKWKDHKVVNEYANEKTIAKYHDLADTLIMDVPCTGSGTLKRQADLKYRINHIILDEKTSTQRMIFHNFHPTLKSGGTLIYSTCSLFQSENEKQIDYIISQGYELISSLNIEPCKYDGDGFYVAKLRKK